MKEHDSPNFVVDPHISRIILNISYTIYKSKIFYLFEQTPLQKGILDMEELADKEIIKDDKT